MFQLLKNPNFDFMGIRRTLLTVSALLVLGSVVVLSVHGLELGVEFAGGTEMQLRYATTPDISAIRSSLRQAGLGGAVVTRIGQPDENEVYIRIATRPDDPEDPTAEVLGVLRTAAGADMSRPGINVTDQATLAGVLRQNPSLGDTDADTLATEVLAARKERAIFSSIDDLKSLPGFTPELVDWLRTRVSVGPLALRSQSYIGPAVGAELVRKAIIAIIGSLIGMLAYIWFRFQLQWGFAAVLALVHDTVITLGLFSLFGYEMSLPVVAAFLTLIGYSVNDTVVVFDRIRENLQNYRTPDLASTVNLSINQTLSRTIITSGLTWIVVFGLFLFGGSALRPFSFVLTAGIIVGTYSSIWVASPFLVLWKAFLDRRKTTNPAETGAGRRAKKVRTSQGA